jgi:hypothetical protein
MALSRIHRGKQPRRPHFIPEWAERRGYESQADLAEALQADKSVVSRWYSGTSPSEEWQKKLAGLFHCEREALFRHPDDDWLARFFLDRDDHEMTRIKQMLEAAFPKTKKTG